MTDEPKFKRYGGEGEPASPGEAIAAYIGIGAFAVVGCGILTVLFLFAFGWL